MTEHPILFSGEMVRAILDGRKTQTRRVIVPQPPACTRELGMSDCRSYCRDFPAETRDWKCPYGQLGDLLWVRETWQDYCPIWKGGWCGHGDKEAIAREHQPVYRADPPELHIRNGGPPKRWRPSIHMPRWASRITLEVTAVRVERLQDISEEDAMAEGLFDIRDNLFALENWAGGPFDTAQAAFQYLWDSINGTRKDKHGNRLPYAWDDNPWVWVGEFQRL